MLSVDVVVPVLDRSDLTRACLHDLAAQDLPHTVTSVDGGSTDGTLSMLRDEFPDVGLVEVSGTRGTRPPATRAPRGDRAR